MSVLIKFKLKTLVFENFYFPILSPVAPTSTYTDIGFVLVYELDLKQHVLTLL